VEVSAVYRGGIETAVYRGELRLQSIVEELSAVYRGGIETAVYRGELRLQSIVGN